MENIIFLLVVSLISLSALAFVTVNAYFAWGSRPCLMDMSEFNHSAPAYEVSLKPYADIINSQFYLTLDLKNNG